MNARMAVVLTVLFASAALGQAENCGPSHPDAVPNRFIIGIATKWQSSTEQFSDVLEGLESVTSARVLPSIRAVEVTGREDLLVPELRKRRLWDYVEHKTPVYYRYGTAKPDDRLYPRQWAHKAMSSETAWDLATNARNAVMAITDSGIDIDHPDLAGNLWWNPAETPGDGVDNDGNGIVDDVHGARWKESEIVSGLVQDDHNHGTWVAGIAGAVGNNAKEGIAGTAWSARLMILKFLHPVSGKTLPAGTDTDAIEALHYAQAHGARVVNASWGSRCYSADLEKAIDDLRKAGILVVAAAGNFGTNNDDDKKTFYPASFKLENVISVLSTTEDQEKAPNSCFGPTSVDLGAPGSEIMTTSIDGYSSRSGTSMAAPFVSAAAALLETQRGRQLSITEFRTRLLSAVDKLPALNGMCATGGRLNLRKLLEAP